MQRYEFDVEREFDYASDRYGAKFQIVHNESDIGEWVKFSDAQALQNEIDRLQSELEELKSGVDE